MTEPGRQQNLQERLRDVIRVRRAIQQAALGTADADAAFTKISCALQEDGSPTAIELLGHITAIRKQGIELDSAKLGLMGKHLTMLWMDIKESKTPQQASVAIQYHAQKGNIPEQQAQELLLSVPPVDDPRETAFAVWKGIQAKRLGTAMDLLVAITPVTWWEDLISTNDKGQRVWLRVCHKERNQVSVLECCPEAHPCMWHQSIARSKPITWN